MDWADIAIHCGVSLLASAVLLWLGAPGISVMVLSSIFWLGRELWQHRDDPAGVITRPQPFLEWTTPVAVTAGAIAAWRLL